MEKAVLNHGGPVWGQRARRTVGQPLGRARVTLSVRDYFFSNSLGVAAVPFLAKGSRGEFPVGRDQLSHVTSQPVKLFISW